MAQSGTGPISGIPGTPATPAPRRAVLGKIALALSLVPWAVMLALMLIRPG